MTAQDIAAYIRSYVPNFVDVEILSSGTAYHYTTHADQINADGRFLGAPLTPDLDRTQNNPRSPQATNDPGVVFAYENINDAVDEGFNQMIVEISYSAAVRATHEQEAALDYDAGAPPTILISSNEIVSFRIVG